MDAEHTVACVVLQADTWVDLLGDGLLEHEVYSCGLPAGWQRCISPGDASSGSYLTCGFRGEDEGPEVGPVTSRIARVKPRLADYDAVEGSDVEPVVVFGLCRGRVRVRPRLASNILLWALKEWAEIRGRSRRTCKVIKIFE